MTNNPASSPLVSPFATNAGNDVPTGTPFTPAEAQAAEVQASAAKVTQEAAPVNPNALIIPDYSQTAPTMAPLVAAQFAHVATGSGAKKLASSAVAPLVAAARGYATITPDNLKASAEKLGVKLNTTHGKQIKTAAETGDTLLMKWFSLTAVAEAATRGEALESETYQLRPARAVVNAKGKEAKYLMPAGTETVLGLHPSTPASWIFSAPRVIIAEGLLKADSLFTAHLISHGISEAELLNAYQGNADVARAMLTRLMESIPEADRVLVLSIVGCTTWAGKIAWASISLKGRDVWIAMDADIAVNRAVWNQAHQMEAFLKAKKAGSVAVVTLPPVDGDTKAGLDDFFAAGHNWSELEAAVGDLPTAPLMTRRSIEINLPSVDLHEAVTYETRTVERDGIPEVEATDLAEAAVEIEKVVSLRSPLPGVMGSEAITGQVAWQVRKRGGGKEIRRAKFVEKSLQLLIGHNPTVPTALAGLATGAAVGAAVKKGAGRDVLEAWTASAGEAEAIEAIQTTGLWVDNDENLGWLTSEGILRAEGLGTDLRAADLGAVPAVEIPWIDPVASAKEVTDAWEVTSAWRKILNPVHTGMWEVSVGMMMATAVGLQTKGVMVIFCKRGSGKTAALGGLSAFYGPKWVEEPALTLSATLAVVNRDIDGTNNLVLTADDARNDDNIEVSSSTKDLERVRSIVTSIVRMGYKPSSVKKRSVPAVGGGWITPPNLPHASRTAIITGEDLAELGLAPSTAQRLLSFQTTTDLPLLAGQGEIGPANEKLAETKAASKLMGAYLVSHLKDAEANATEGQREHLQAKMRALREEEGTALVEAPDGPSLRSSELLAPAMAGLRSLLEMVAEAYRVQGRNAEADALISSHEGNRKAVVQAWQRHQERYGDDTDDMSRGLVEALTEALATGAARWENQAPMSNIDDRAVVIGKNNFAPRGSDSKDDIVLLPNNVVQVLGKMGRKVSRPQVASAFREIVISDRKGIRVGGVEVKGWHIPRDRWDASLGLGADAIEEAEEITRTAVSVPAPAGTPSSTFEAPDEKDWNF